MRELRIHIANPTGCKPWQHQNKGATQSCTNTNKRSSDDHLNRFRNFSVFLSAQKTPLTYVFFIFLSTLFTQVDSDHALLTWPELESLSRFGAIC